MINDEWKETLQDCDAEIIVHRDCEGRYPFPVVQPESEKTSLLGNYDNDEDGVFGYRARASHEAGWWLDPRPLLGCTPESTFDVRRLHGWHRFCGGCHGRELTSCDPTRFVAIPGMLLIDTRTFTLVPAPEGVAYVALSYVWGQLKDPFRTIKANRETLMATGGLSKAALPRTIRESVEVVKAIGFRYLWFDSICIVQDDPESSMGQIRVMDKIYEGAALTLVAVGGTSADDPLNTSRYQIHAEVFGELKLMARNRPFETALWRSRWNSRAWCYQERFLSSRMLVFTGGEVYYDCSHFRWCESLESPESERVISTSTRKFILGDTSIGTIESGHEGTETQSPWLFWSPMKFILEEYTLLALTNENDVLSANGVF